MSRIQSLLAVVQLVVYIQMEIFHQPVEGATLSLKQCPQGGSPSLSITSGSFQNKELINRNLMKRSFTMTFESDSSTIVEEREIKDLCIEEDTVKEGEKFYRTKEGKRCYVVLKRRPGDTVNIERDNSGNEYGSKQGCGRIYQRKPGSHENFEEHQLKGRSRITYTFTDDDDDGMQLVIVSCGESILVNTTRDVPDCKDNGGQISQPVGADRCDHKFTAQNKDLVNISCPSMSPPLERTTWIVEKERETVKFSVSRKNMDRPCTVEKYPKVDWYYGMPIPFHHQIKMLRRNTYSTINKKLESPYLDAFCTEKARLARRNGNNSFETIDLNFGNAICIPDAFQGEDKLMIINLSSEANACGVIYTNSSQYVKPKKVKPLFRDYDFPTGNKTIVNFGP